MENNIEKSNTGKKKSIADYVEVYLNNRYNFRYNVVMNRVEGKFKNQSKSEFIPLTDFHYNSLFREITKANLNCGIDLLRRLLMSNFVNKYNPFRDYLDNLEDWDERTDFINLLAETVNTTNDILWEKCFKKWMVALVGSLIKDDVVNHTVIVFSGKQGVGKTSWIMNLVPSQLKEYCYSGTINPNNKDTLIQLSECFLINLDELENLNKTELGTMKEVITKSNIRFRRPYGHESEIMPRRASFIGSVNGNEFLNDTTGSRRFLCFEVTEIEYTNTIPLDQVYAQALYLYNSGFQFWFDSKEIDEINKNNEQYRFVTFEEELLHSYFEKCLEEEGDFFWSTTELLNWFVSKNKLKVTSNSKQNLGKALRACSFERIKRNGRYVYVLKKKEDLVEKFSDYFSKVVSN